MAKVEKIEEEEEFDDFAAFDEKKEDDEEEVTTPNLGTVKRKVQPVQNPVPVFKKQIEADEEEQEQEQEEEEEEEQPQPQVKRAAFARPSKPMPAKPAPVPIRTAPVENTRQEEQPQQERYVPYAFQTRYGVVDRTTGQALFEFPDRESLTVALLMEILNRLDKVEASL